MTFRAHATGRVRRPAAAAPDEQPDGVETVPGAAPVEPVPLGGPLPPDFDDTAEQPAPKPRMRFRVEPRRGRGRGAARQAARDGVDFGGDLERRQATAYAPGTPPPTADGPARSSPRPEVPSSAAVPGRRGRPDSGRRGAIAPPGPPAPAGPGDTTQER